MGTQRGQRKQGRISYMKDFRLYSVRMESHSWVLKKQHDRCPLSKYPRGSNMENESQGSECRQEPSGVGSPYVLDCPRRIDGNR